MNNNEGKALEDLQLLLEEDLLKLHGVVLSGEVLLRSLGYPSKAAFRQSLVRGTVPVPIFNMEKRRGKYALSKDVASYLARIRMAVVKN